MFLVHTCGAVLCPDYVPGYPHKLCPACHGPVDVDALNVVMPESNDPERIAARTQAVADLAGLPRFSGLALVTMPDETGGGPSDGLDAAPAPAPAPITRSTRAPVARSTAEARKATKAR